MKIQELAIVFVIIILPISLLLSEYTQFQISTLNTQTLYDSRLTSATYDAIKAFQLNATNSTTSDIANSKLRDLSASVNSFRNSIMSAFKLNGYTADALNSYIPALVYTLYDGFYIYSPYTNVNYRYIDNETGESITKTDATSSDVSTDGNGEKIYGLKPYISYSCRYKTSNIDVVITYSLDNYVTVQGMIDYNYVNKSGYLIDGIVKSGNDTDYTIRYNGVEIKTERLYENLGGNIYPYAKINGTKYYLIEEGDNARIVYISNGILKTQYKKDEGEYDKYKKIIENNNFARQYYNEAYEFTNWFKNSGLENLTYANAYDEVINQDDASISIEQVWKDDTRKIFEFNSTGNTNENIENELSNFNQHRLAVIRHKIETNLSIAISNYNSYSGATSNIFQMPELKEDEWDQIIHNISLISFLQGLPIGGKIYNGYAIVTNSESKEVVLENYIYILGDDGAYHKIGDNYFEKNEISVYARNYGDKRSAGRLNLDFERIALTDNIKTYYYYPLKDYNASYNSIVMQNDVTTYEDIYTYVNGQSDDLKIAFYTALGRERAGQYSLSSTMEEVVVKLSNDSGIFN